MHKFFNSLRCRAPSDMVFILNFFSNFNQLPEDYKANLYRPPLHIDILER